MPLRFTFTNSIGHRDAGVAVCAVCGLSENAPIPDAADSELLALLASRKSAELNAREESVRAACRDMLRNGSYKPTGRGKPASEYLLGAAKTGTFPRVSALVDINNLVSLKYMLPISIWDADLCSSGNFEFRLGKKEERYVFNPSGQELDLEDLVCGCELTREESLPIVTPIKDGMRTKVRPGTRTAIGAIYYPAGILAGEEIGAANSRFLQHLLSVSPGTTGAGALLLPGESTTLEI